MRKIATGIAAILFMMPVTISGIAAQTSANKDIEALKLCDYCHDYTDTAMAAGSVRTAYQVGVGYPEWNAKPVQTGKSTSAQNLGH